MIISNGNLAKAICEGCGTEVKGTTMTIYGLMEENNFRVIWNEKVSVRMWESRELSDWSFDNVESALFCPKCLEIFKERKKGLMDSLNAKLAELWNITINIGEGKA